MPAREKFLIGLFLNLGIFLFFSREVLADNLLQNQGFEDGLTYWTKGVSTATFDITPKIKHSGNYGALLTKLESKGLAYFYQKVSVKPGKYYKLSGWVFLNDSFINNVKLRFYWQDAGGTNLSLVEKETKTFDENFQFLETEITCSPSEAISAEIQAYVYLNAPNPLNPPVFDDLVFEEVIPPTLTPTPAPTPTPIPTSTSTPKDYSNIFISEFMAYPESGDEWVELYNDNGFEVDLYGWYIDDIAEGGSTPRQISGTISPKSQKQFSLNTNAYLNNGGDDVRLLNANQVEKDKVSFETTSKGKSWSKDKNGKWCQLDPSPNAPNPECPKEEDSPNFTPTSTPTQKPPSPTPTPKPTPTLKIVPTEATKSGEVLGEEEEATVGGFYPLEATEEAKEAKEATSAGNKNSKNKILGGIFIGAGLVAIFGAAFSLWYTKLK